MLFVSIVISESVLAYSFKLAIVALPSVSVCKLAIFNSTFSFACAIFVCSFAVWAFVNIPLLPTVKLIVIPAKISSTIIAITSAIRDIPL